MAIHSVLHPAAANRPCLALGSAQDNAKSHHVRHERRSIPVSARIEHRHLTIAAAAADEPGPLHTSDRSADFDLDSRFSLKCKKNESTGLVGVGPDHGCVWGTSFTTCERDRSKSWSAARSPPSSISDFMALLYTPHLMPRSSCPLQWQPPPPPIHHWHTHMAIVVSTVFCGDHHQTREACRCHRRSCVACL